MAKKFMFVCVGIFLLAGAFALGARSVDAQSMSGDVVAAFVTGVPASNEVATVAVTANGDIFARGGSPKGSTHDPYISWSYEGHWLHMGNVFEDPVSADSGSLNDLKSMFR